MCAAALTKFGASAKKAGMRAKARTAMMQVTGSANTIWRSQGPIVESTTGQQGAGGTTRSLSQRTCLMSAE